MEGIVPHRKLFHVVKLVFYGVQYRLVSDSCVLAEVRFTNAGT